MDPAQLSAGLTYFIIIPGLYLYWLWRQKELNWQLLLAPAVLLICLLLAVGVEHYVYERAEVVSYYPEEIGFMDPISVQRPRYAGESWSVYTGGLAPVLGWLLLLRWQPALRRPTHVVHFLVCLVFLYAPAVCFAVAETGFKPSYQLHETMPPIGSKGHQPQRPGP